MNKSIILAAMLVVFAIPTAKARCWPVWNGYTWVQHCDGDRGYWEHHEWREHERHHEWREHERHEHDRY